MRIMILALLAATLSLFAAAPASAQMMDTCTHDASKIAALSACVQHAVDNGYIDNKGIARGLFAKLDAAQKAVDRNQPAVAINKLKAFIHEIDAQSGKHIASEHAAHMRMHAEAIIAALQQP